MGFTVRCGCVCRSAEFKLFDALSGFTRVPGVAKAPSRGANGQGAAAAKAVYLGRDEEPTYGHPDNSWTTDNSLEQQLDHVFWRPGNTGLDRGEGLDSSMSWHQVGRSDLDWQTTASDGTPYVDS